MTPPVRTPAVVLVDAGCPSCEERQPILLTVTAELLVSDDGAELRLKGKSKGVTHVCGQLPLNVTPSEAEGQTSFGEAVLDAMADQVRAGAMGPDWTVSEDGRTITVRADGRVPCPQDGCTYSAENAGSIPAHLAMAHPEVPMDEVAPARRADPVPAPGDALVDDGAKYRIREITEIGATAIAQLAAAGPSWKRTPVVAATDVHQLAWDRVAAVWRGQTWAVQS